MSVNLTHNENLNHLPSYPQSKTTYDRFVPNRALMEKNYAIPAYWVSTPSNPYELDLYHTAFPGRQPNQPTLVLSDRKMKERKKEYCEDEMSYEGNCSAHMTKPCEWIGETFTIATTNSVYYTSMNTKKTTCFVLDEDAEVYAFAWNPAETHLAVAYDQNALTLWDRNIEAYTQLSNSNGKASISQLEWKSPHLIAVGFNLAFALMDQRVGKSTLEHLNFLDLYSGFRCSKDGNRIYLTTSTGCIKTIDIRNANELLASQQIATKTLTHFDFLNTKEMITTSRDGYIRIFDVKGEKFKLTKKINTKREITSFARLNDFWVTGHNKTACYWDAVKYEKFYEKSISGLSYLFTDPSKKRLGVLHDGQNGQNVSFLRV